MILNQQQKFTSKPYKLSESMHSHKKIRFNVIIFGLMLIFVFTNNNKALGIAGYYIFPITFILSSFLNLLLNHNKLKVDNIILKLCVVIISFNIANIITPFNLDRGYFLSYTLNLIFAILVIAQSYKRQELKYLISCYIISTIIISLMIIIFRIEYPWVGTSRYSIKFMGNDIMEVNYLSAYLVGAVFFSFSRVFSSKKFQKFIYSIVSLLIVIAILMTSSRAAFIGIGICFISVTLDYLINISNISINKLIQLIFASIFIIIFFSLIYKIIPEGVFKRLFEDSYMDESNNIRVGLWKYASECIFNSWKSFIFGYGAVPTENILFSMTGYLGDAHNSFLSFWLQTGLFGFVSIVAIFINLLIKGIKQKAIVLVGLLVYIIFIGNVIAAGQSLSFWINILLISIIINQYTVDKKNFNFRSIIEYL